MSFDLKTGGPSRVTYECFALGADGADLTIQAPNSGFKSIARTGEGAYTITFARDYGKFVGAKVGFSALVPADLKGYTAVFGLYSASGKTLTFVVYGAGATPAAADLIADQYITLNVTFKAVGD